MSLENTSAPTLSMVPSLTETRLASAPKSKRSRVARVDDYLRRSNSGLTKTMARLSNRRGADYLQGQSKRVLDFTLSLPACVVSLPFILGFGILKKLEDGGSMFFTQKRLGRDGKLITIWKIRCMRPNSDLGKENIAIARGKHATHDPRNTRLGSFMRRYQIEEFPQFLLVLSGRLSLVGVRPHPPYVGEFLKDFWSQRRLETWEKAYSLAKPGLSGLNQMFGSNSKEDHHRYHLDVFYIKHASLGFDCYLLWRTFVKLTRLLK